MSQTSAPPRTSAPTTGPPPDAPPAPGPSGPSRWIADLALGGRFAVTGGWEGWIRTLLTAVGVGLGVAVLLLASSVPTALEARDARQQHRFPVLPHMEQADGQDPAPSDTTALVHDVSTVFHDQAIQGSLIRPDGHRPPVPPGLTEVPAPGEAVVSPALRELLASDEGELLRERLPYEIVGTIGNEGLLHPGELVYYAGGDRLAGADESGIRIAGYGWPLPSGGLDGVEVLLVVVICVVLLLPVAVFLATAVRFGSERRDRRLAALRLVGADVQMTRRIAAGEALAGSLFGLALGGALFLLLRHFADSVELMGVSVFSADVRPAPGIAVFVLLSVPLAAVLVGLLAMRRIVVEPLGVVRRGTTRGRRLWWRLVLPALGVLLLLPLVGDISATNNDVRTYQIATGMILVLFGITTVLPWLLERVTGWLRGGPVPLQLAVRRLRLDGEPAVRAVGGITIALAGAIAVQMLFGSVSERYILSPGLEDRDGQFQVSLGTADTDRLPKVNQAFEETPGVRDVLAMTKAYAFEPDAEETLREIVVADCATLTRLAGIDSCREGQVFLPRQSPDGDQAPALPGMPFQLNSVDETEAGAESPVIWKVPKDAVPVAARSVPEWLSLPDAFATPSAIDVSHGDDVSLHVHLISDPDAPEVLEHVRNTAAAQHLDSSVLDLGAEIVDDDFASIQRALYAGAIGVLLLIAVSMIVSTLEQLRDRRRLLSVLVAFGTRRSTLCWSVLWQTALPVVLGLALALVTGIGLGTLLLRMVSAEMLLDWVGILTMTGLGAALILLVTALSLPTLWRMLRPDGLRTE